MAIKTNQFKISILPKFYNDFQIICMRLKDEYVENNINRIELLVDPYLKFIESINISNEYVNEYAEKKKCLWILIKNDGKIKKYILDKLDKFEEAKLKYTNNDNIKIKLLISALPRFKAEGLSNVIGSIYQFVDQKSIKNQLVFLKYDIYDGVISHSVQTFSLYKVAKFHLTEEEKNQTRYTFDSGILNVSNANSETDYIIGNKISKKDTRNTVEFFRSAKSLEGFLHTRVYYFQKMLQEIKKYLVDYLIIEELTQESYHISIKNVDNSRIGLIKKESYNIVNLSLNKNDDILMKLEVCLKRAFPNEDLDIVANNQIDENKINIIVVNTKEEYEEKNELDQYVTSNNYVRQHIYLHQLVEAYGKLNEKNECMIGKVILTDAYIKKEIIQKKINMYSFHSNYFKNANFILPTRKDKKSEIIYVSMTIDNNNELEFNKLRESEFRNKYNFKQEGYISINGKLLVISDTNLITLPNIEYVMEKYRKVEKFETITKNELINVLTDFSKVIHENNNRKRLFFDDACVEINQKIDKLLDNNLTSDDVRNILSPLKRITTYGLYGSFINFFDKQKDKLIAPLLNSPKAKEQYLQGFEGITYFFKKNDLYYSVGHPKLSDISFSISKALRIKKIQGLEHEMINDYFEMLDVSFIRYKQATVVPFPFKYVREYVKMQTDLVTDEIKD